MKLTLRVLVVDDDEAFLEMYHDLMTDEGYLVHEARTADAALELLDESDGWAVVILDQKLKGPGGPDQGIDLIEEVSIRAPAAKIIIVTAFATEATVERAFKAGVYDFIEKTDRFQPSLLAKVRNAVEAVRDQHLASLDLEGAEAELLELWEAARSENDPHRKGRLLEDVVVLVFRSIPGFGHVDARRRSSAEEFDVLIRNQSTDPLWSKESSFFLVECKHRKEPTGREELDVFRCKMKRRHGRCRLGFFVSLGGYTVPFRELSRSSEGEWMVVLLDAKAFDKLVRSAEDRDGELKRLLEQAVLDANGG